MSTLRICSLDELTEGKAHSFEAAGQPLCVVRAGHAVYAVDDVCSHAEVSLSEGDLDGLTVECWLHGSRFDVRTGEPTGPPAFEPITTFPVAVDGADVFVTVP